MGTSLLYRAQPRKRVGRPYRFYGFLDARDREVTPPETNNGGWPDGFAWPIGGVGRLGYTVVESRPFRLLTRELAREEGRPDDPGWRRDRTAQLRSLFEKLPPRRLEIFPPLEFEAAAGLRAQYRPGGWFRLVVRSLVTPDPVAAGLLWSTDDIGREAVTLTQLQRISAVERSWLRRIFSLDHVGDLGRKGPDGEPVPTPPIVPSWLGRGLPPRKRAPTVVFGASRLLPEDKVRFGDGAELEKRVGSGQLSPLDDLMPGEDLLG